MDCLHNLSNQFWDQTVNGLVLGSIYAMIALGYTMVYGVLQLINFAHSEVFMVGTVVTLHAMTDWFNVTHPLTGVALVLVFAGGLAAAMLASGVTALTVERFAYRPLRRRGAPRLAFLIAAIGASFCISYLFNLMDGNHYLAWYHLPALLGPAPQAVPAFLARDKVFSLFGTTVTNKQLIVIVVAVVMMVGLDLFVRRSRLGRGIRAVSQDPGTASLMGVNIDRVVVVTFFVGGLMAGAAGFLFSGIFPGAPAFWFIGFYPGIKAFTAAVLGGIGNVRGAMAGGLLLGMVESYAGPCFGFQWVNVVSFVVLVLVLMFRPTGIFGEQVADRA